jgi:BMFP domain-containing protein YqiC
MPQTRILEDASAKIREVLAASPAKDLEKNLRAMLVAVFERLELATREELEVQQQVLARTREKLAALETRVAELEARLRQR